MWPNLQFSADLVTFIEEMLDGKLHFLCSAIAHPPSPPILLKKKAILPPHLPSPVILKEELTDLFWKLLGISYPYRQIASSYITKLC